MKTQDKATARQFRFCIMSPGGEAKFLALDESHANEIVGRLAAVGLKSTILHINAAKDRDIHGVVNLLALESSRKPVKTETVRISKSEHAALVAVAASHKRLVESVEKFDESPKSLTDWANMRDEIWYSKEAQSNLAAVRKGAQ